MRSGGGHIINLASMSAFGPVPCLAAYGAKKHALLASTDSVRGERDEAKILIRMLTVCAYGVNTAMVGERAMDPKSGVIFTSSTIMMAPGTAENNPMMKEHCKAAGIKIWIVK